MRVWIVQCFEYFKIFETEEEANKFAEKYNTNDSLQMQVYSYEVYSSADEAIGNTHK